MMNEEAPDQMKPTNRRPSEDPNADEAEGFTIHFGYLFLSSYLAF